MLPVIMMLVVADYLGEPRPVSITISVYDLVLKSS